MKKTLVALSAVLILLGSAVPAHAEKQSYTFGVFWNAGDKLNTSYIIIAKDLTKAFSQSENIQLSNLYYSNLESFHDDIGTRKLDFIYANTEDDFLLATIYGYKPFATLSIFGKEKSSHCLYVKKDSPITGLDGLAGKKLITYPHQVAYTLLRKLLQSPPEKTFSAMTTSTDAYAMVGALAAGAVDAILLVETNIDYFELVNPGPVKEIRKLACAEPQYFMPLMVSPEVSDEMLKRMETFYVNLLNNKALDKYRPLMKQINFKVIPVTEANYAQFFTLYEFAMAQGWDKDFEAWIATAQPVK
jgi:ABC-type phosphate/phosphonate transport system substrate-binding protein